MDSQRLTERLLPKVADLLFKLLEIDSPDPGERQQGQVLVVLACISITGAVIVLFLSLVGALIWPGFVSVEAGIILGFLLSYLAGMGVILVLAWSGRISIATILWLTLVMTILAGVTIVNVHGRSQHMPAVLLQIIVMAALIRGPRGALVAAGAASLFEAAFAFFVIRDFQLDLLATSVILNLAMVAMMSFYTSLGRANLAAAPQSRERANIQLGADYISRASRDGILRLNMITGYVRVISQTDKAHLSQDSLNALAEIQHNTHRLIDELDDLVDFIELERGTVPITIDRADPTMVIDAIAAQLSDTAESRGLRLSCICDPGLPAVVETDILLLRHTLLRLIESVLVSMKDGEHLSVQAHMHGRYRWLIHIQDTAKGFELSPGWESLENTGGPLTRRDRIKRLAHTRAVVMTLGGTVHVQADQSHGTTVLISLPIHQRLELALRGE